MNLLIIIPTFQRPQLLNSCLDSIFSQLILHVKVLVVDQSFDDSSRLICKQFPQVNYIHVNYQNKSRAINEGLSKYNDDIISIIDDDTILDKNWVKAVFRVFSNSEIDVVQGSIMLSDNSFDDAVNNNQDIVMKRKIIGRTIIPPLFKIGCNFAFRRRVFYTVGAFNDTLGPGTKNKAGEDLEWGYRVLKKGYKLLLNPEMCITHTSWREETDLITQTAEYGYAFGKVLRIIRKECFLDFFAYYIHYLLFGYAKNLFESNRLIWYKSALKSYREV